METNQNIKTRKPFTEWNIKVPDEEKDEPEYDANRESYIKERGLYRNGIECLGHKRLRALLYRLNTDTVPEILRFEDKGALDGSSQEVIEFIAKNSIERQVNLAGMRFAGFNPGYFVCDMKLAEIMADRYLSGKDSLGEIVKSLRHKAQCDYFLNPEVFPGLKDKVERLTAYLSDELPALNIDPYRGLGSFLLASQVSGVYSIHL